MFKFPIRSHRVCDIAIDFGAVKNDLLILKDECYSKYYSEYSFGEWTTCMLMNQSGSVSDNRIYAYNTPAIDTPHLKALNYLRDFLEFHFDLSEIRFLRIAKNTPNSLVFPHKDYLDFEGELIRLHFPLFANPNVKHSESDVTYHMKPGELWFLDASNVHSAINMGKDDRYALIIDFNSSNKPFHFLKDKDNLNPSFATSLPRVAKRHSDIISEICEAPDKSIKGLLAAATKANFLYSSHIYSVFDWVDEALSILDDSQFQKFETLKNQFLLTG